MKTLLSARVMRYLGNVSFSLYLLHVLILGTLASAILVWLAPHVSYIHALLGVAAISTPVTLLAAHFFTNLIDKPTVHMANAISHRWFMAKV